MPTYWPTLSAVWSRVCPSPMVTTMLGGANGRSSRNRQTPEKLSGSRRSAHLASKSRERARDGEPVPVVDDVEQVAAGRAGEMRLVDGEGRPAAGIDALLERGIACRVRRSSWLLSTRSSFDRLTRIRTGEPASRSRPAAPPGPRGISPSVQITLPATAPGSQAGSGRATGHVRLCLDLVRHRTPVSPTGRQGANVSASEEALQS